MKYYLKEIKEEEFADFLLNPFERAAYLGDFLIQKYQRNPYVDDFFSTNLKFTEIKRLGHIIYKTNEVVLERAYVFKSSLVDKPPFVTDLELKNNLEEEIKLKLEEIKEAKKGRLDEIKLSQKYKDLYHNYKSSHFSSMVFAALGTTDINLAAESKTKEVVREYVSNIKSDDLAESRSGNLDLVSPIIKKLTGSINFIVSEILINELSAYL